MKQICLSLSQCFIEHLLYVLGYHSQGPSGRAIPVRLLVHSEGMSEGRTQPGLPLPGLYSDSGLCLPEEVSSHTGAV